ncbi:pentatricopeptide repeat-containing protein At5g42450, mitochondrial-like [Nicotiana sylvestris]|uniref:Pentatricopeptide repeat-containing protein At5g42450, mitochondrial-like n=2 Tax=Nicotiana TaxID=4085 RepID=A0A1S3Y6I3_TOBAC|nr:PREDICTED: pentatricopeptide repeat-containing protein At5g42450, mitochondrial-like [Nicotiana sylvestris]XP_016447823.1 PREDICTED: pentatricopeptide repeat-containing protein At5g42450, mitochondrial-like [Nicotiana tabacum]
MRVCIRARSSICRLLSQAPNAREHLHNLGVPTIEPSILISQCGKSADSMFDELPKCDVVSATALVSRFTRLNHHKKAITIFSRMFEYDVRPNEFTLGTSNVYVGSALLDLYVKLSSIEEAQLVFEDTHVPNVVSYTTLVCGYLKEEKFDEAMEIFRIILERNVVIRGYSQKGRNEDVVNLFVEMLRQRVVPDQST